MPSDLGFRAFTAVHRTIYRLTGGRLGGRMGGGPMLLLTTTGRRTGVRRTVVLLYLREGESLLVVGSKGGSPQHPGWFHNLRADPGVEVEIGRRRERRRARVATPEERARLWPGIVERYPGYRKYERRTAREIPLVLLDRV